jgi:integrase
MPQDFRRDRGSWRYVFEHKGQKYSKLGFRTKKAAMLAEADHRKALAITRRVPGAIDKITLAEYAELWLSDHVKSECRPRTARLYRGMLERHVLPALGTAALVDLTRAQLRGHFATLGASGLSRNTVKNCLIPLRAMLNAAIEDGHLEVNPAVSLGRRALRNRTEQDAAKVEAYSTEELAELLSGAPLPIRTLALSGLRLGELLGLQVDDLEDGFLWIRRNVQWQDRVAHVLAPKNGRVRRVDIPQDLVQRLKLAAGSGPYVFGGERPWRPEKVRKLWHHHLDTFWVVRRLRVHDLRHTYAALMLGKGAPPSYVKEQLGHSSIQVTVDTYGHLIPGANRKWVDDTFGS